MIKKVSHGKSRCTNMQISGNKGSGNFDNFREFSGSFENFPGVFRNLWESVPSLEVKSCES